MAVVGRILVGAGDATVFVSLIRLVSSWFSGRIVPQLSQWIGNIGQLGQVLSALPFAWILRTYGLDAGLRVCGHGLRARAGSRRSSP